MADLKGPGYVSRFWMTGAVKPHRIRFYFDGERTPRVDTTIQELCGGTFKPPLAANENLCWYCLVPIPYAKRLVLMTEEGGTTSTDQPKIFYQISEVPLPPAVAVESFPRQMTDEDQAALATLSKAWQELSVSPQGLCGAGFTQSVIVAIGPNETGWVLDVPGPALIDRIAIEPDVAESGSAVALEELLRSVIVRVYWDNQPVPSIESPLGDFCGSFWCRTRYLSAYFGTVSNTFINRLPMPFEHRARMALENQGNRPVSLRVSCDGRALDNWSSRWGYLHGQWRRRGPEPDGKPYVVLNLPGAGKYVGCIVAVSSLEKSWWLLEGDDHIFLDGEKMSSWNGTGLEDYFTGGWYYHNVLARPFHGLLFKSPFRTVQYRLHISDPLSFTNGIYMIFERGPQNVSRGWFESLAFCYLRAPAPSGSETLSFFERRPPVDPELAPLTIMIELTNFERFDDYTGARDYLRSFLEKYPTHPYAAILRLRELAYREKLEGYDAVRTEYERVMISETNPAVRAMADALLWFHASPSNGLLGAFCNRPTRIYLDGKLVGETRNDYALHIYRVTLSSGPHVLALQNFFQQYPDWVLACLRTHSGDIMTTPDWKWAYCPSGNWMELDYDDAAWGEVKGAVKGPPEEPWFWMEPNALVDMQSKAKGIMKSEETPRGRGFVVYRKSFTVP